MARKQLGLVRSVDSNHAILRPVGEDSRARARSEGERTVDRAGCEARELVPDVEAPRGGWRLGPPDADARAEDHAAVPGQGHPLLPAVDAQRGLHDARTAEASRLDPSGRVVREHWEPDLEPEPVWLPARRRDQHE